VAADQRKEEDGIGGGGLQRSPRLISGGRGGERGEGLLPSSGGGLDVGEEHLAATEELPQLGEASGGEEQVAIPAPIAAAVATPGHLLPQPAIQGWPR
jgi:hypothetical protein